MDNVPKEVRSRIMSKVRSAGNKSTELSLIELFKEFRIKGWRRRYKLLGKPDFVFPKRRIAVFSDGCFWHGHGCRNIRPQDNAEYWKNKIERNKERDRKVTKTLKQKGWQVIRIWECKIRRNELPNDLKLFI